MGFRDNMTALRNLLKRLLRPDMLLSTAYLACLILVAFSLMRPLLFRSWFFMSDEYVYAAELIRFSNLDFQTAPGIRDYATIAGLLAGVAAGARLHSMTAALPVLAITLWVSKPVRKPEYPTWILRWSRFALPLLWVCSVLLVVYIRMAA